MSEVDWVRIVVEVPPSATDDAVPFWAAVTGSAPESAGTDTLLIPPDGDPYVSVRATDYMRRSVALVLGTSDPAELSRRARDLGATPVGSTMRSPGEFRFEIEESARPRQRQRPSQREGTTSRLDQVCIDCPPPIFDAEVAFWSGLTGWPSNTGTLTEFSWLSGPSGVPVRLVFQRLGEGHRGDRARGHLDLACGDDVDPLIEAHEALGARRGRRGRVWHTMADPTGLSYCLTERDPETGFIERSF